MAAKELLQGPPWLLRLFIPFIARQVARALSAKYPGLGPQEIAEKMRAELGRARAMALGSPLWALVVLVAMKIGLDWMAHVKEHSKA